MRRPSRISAEACIPTPSGKRSPSISRRIALSTTSALHLQGEELWLAVLAYQSSFVYAGIQHQVAAVLAEGEVGELNAPAQTDGIAGAGTSIDGVLTIAPVESDEVGTNDFVMMSLPEPPIKISLPEPSSNLSAPAPPSRKRRHPFFNLPPGFC